VKVSLRIACLAAAVLTLVMLFEVVARYGFGRPTLWSGEVVGLLNLVLFLFAAGPALLADRHARVDFLAHRVPAASRLVRRVALAALALLLLALAVQAGMQAWAAWQGGMVDDVSPWRRPLWPTYALAALGLASFTGFVATGIRRG
jgi:TRAP-type C4-dicarboxylate transport system permease small subunit